MAHVVEASRPIASAIEGLMDLLKDLNAKRIKRKEIKRTMALLRGLSDRELSDLGITRGDIHSVAHGQFSRGQ
jgi:uncharacterized protein YjiS (DUF1127 family)